MNLCIPCNPLWHGGVLPQGNNINGAAYQVEGFVVHPFLCSSSPVSKQLGRKEKDNKMTGAKPNVKANGKVVQSNQSHAAWEKNQ